MSKMYDNQLRQIAKFHTKRTDKIIKTQGGWQPSIHLDFFLWCLRVNKYPLIALGIATLAFSSVSGNTGFSNFKKNQTTTSNNTNIFSVDEPENNNIEKFSFFNNTTKQPPLNFKNIIATKIQVNKNVPAIKQDGLQCEKVAESIHQTVEKLPNTKERIIRVLNNKEFKLICTTRDRIRKILSQESSSAFFDPYEKTIYMTNEALNEGLINHEFIHSDNFFRHTTSPCKTDKIEEAVLPIYPATKGNIKKYEQALNRGDDRIRDFQQLWHNHQQNIKLSASQKKRLDTYNLAAKNCLKPLIKDISSLYTYNGLLKLGYKPGQKDFTLTNGGVKMKILSVEKTSQATVTLMEPVDPAVAVFQILSTVKEKLTGSYRQSSPLIKLAERDAYTFEHLSEEAITIFYPEAEKLRKMDLQQCSGESIIFNK